MKKAILFTLFIVNTLAVFAQTGIATGQQAPVFTAKDNSGKTLDLKALLKTHKAVVLFFYRGQWCPYCNKQIEHLQDSLQQLTAKGAYVIGVTPETGENINKTIDKTHASFSIIQDKGYGIDLEKNNGNTDHVLPVPATYVIGKNGKLIFAHFDKDYKKRPSVKSILDVL
jgi:peroxiredoxin